ncbi:MAG: 5'/3'-nucleotidase SurE [Proteobacteria bacterium]|nr:5'/3'-nucleotidase SurE [Pseudomonadota bacterium]MBI3498894.1 5'/3'-nucleotidase SurE [Pseudomonadota bacterium]
MAKFPIDWSKARILVSNDDGIYAPGLKVLERIARSLTKDVWTVAPEQEQSGAGHSLTLRQPLRMRRVSARRFAVDGTPTDCVLLAINHLLKDHRPTLVLSGVNRGANMGEDVTYSGTIAAAMEATLLGVPAVALSLGVAWNKHPHWATAEHFAPKLIRKLAKAGWPDGVLININFPNLPVAEVRGVTLARQGRRKLGDSLVQSTDPRGRLYWWIGDARTEDEALRGTDLWVLRQGRIAMTPIDLNLTDEPTLKRLQPLFK